MRDFESQITNLKAEFQRIADRAPWVRARFTLRDGKFGLFVLGSPVEDAPIVAGTRSGSDMAMVTDLYALTDEANTLAGQLLQSGRYQGKFSSPIPVKYDLSTPQGFWLMFLLHTFHTSVNCWAMGPDGKTLWLGTLKPCESNDGFSGWIDNYPQICVSALTWLRKGLVVDTMQHPSASAVASGSISLPADKNILPAAETPPPNRWAKEGPLGLTLNTNAHTVERNGQAVEFGGNGRFWEVFVKLAERHPNKYPVKDLGHDVWNHDGRDEDPSENQVQQAISAVRKIIKPLGMDVSHLRNIGYILDELISQPGTL